MNLPLRFSIVLKDVQLYFWWIFSLNKSLADLYSFNLIIPELEWCNHLQEQQQHQSTQQPTFTVYTSFHQLYEDLPGLYLTMGEQSLFELNERVPLQNALPLPRNTTQFFNACWFEFLTKDSNNVLLPLHDIQFHDSLHENGLKEAIHLSQPLRFPARDIPYLGDADSSRQSSPRRIQLDELITHPFFCAILACFSTYWVVEEEKNDTSPKDSDRTQILEKGLQALLQKHTCRLKTEEKGIYALEWSSATGSSNGEGIFTSPPIPLYVLKTFRNMYN